MNGAARMKHSVPLAGLAGAFFCLAAAPVPPENAHFGTIGEACSSTASEGIIVGWRLWTTVSSPCANAKLPDRLEVHPDRVSLKVGDSLRFESFTVRALDSRGAVIPSNKTWLEMQETTPDFLDIEPHKRAAGYAVALRPGSFYLKFASTTSHLRTGMQAEAIVEITISSK